MNDVKIEDLNGDINTNIKIRNNYGNFKENIVRFNLNYLTRFGIAGVVVYACWIAIKNYNYWFSWHVILCTFGYLPIMAESLMLFVGDELWSRQMTRTAKYTVHGILVSIGTVMIIAGDALVFHYVSPGYHLYTAHGITGLVSMILLIISIPVGLAIKYYQEVKVYLPFSPLWCKMIHNVLGLSGYVIGIISLCYAYYTSWFIYYTDFESRLVALVVTILASLWTINAAVISLYQQYIPIMAESFMLFAGYELWSRQMTRTAKYTIHRILVSVGTAMVIAGDALAYHYLSSGYHLHTAHGITGLVSMILLIISIPVGLAIKYYQEVKARMPISPLWFKIIHNALGLSGYAIGIISLCYGYYTKWFIFNTDFESRLAALVVTILASLWTIYAAVKSLYQQIKSLVS